MNNTTIAAVVIIILILLGAVAYSQRGTDTSPTATTTVSTTRTPTPTTPTPSVSTTTTPTPTATTTTPATTTTATPSSVSFDITADNFAFDPKTITVKRGQTVTINFKNSEGNHDFVIDEFAGARTDVIGAGATDSITFTADRAGTFEYYCSVGRHREMGMVGSLIVTP